MAYDEGLAERIRDVLGDKPGLVEKNMFGGVAFLLLGNMACGVNKEDLIVRVGPDNYEDSVIRPHARPFDMTGWPMKGWVTVAPAGYEDDRDLEAWIEEGVSFSLSLPPK